MKIIIAATTDIYFDQRVRKIAVSLQRDKNELLVFGRLKGKTSTDILSFQCTLLACYFRRSIFFYAEYNVRLFFKLLFRPVDVIVACDLDTLLACTLASKIKGTKLVFDAHEYFEQSVEIVNKPLVQWCWKAIANLCIPHAHACFTVSKSLCEIFSEQYKKPFHLLRNVPNKISQEISIDIPTKKVIWYQGAVNEGRGLEFAIMSLLELPDFILKIAGDGDRLPQLKKLTEELHLTDRVIFLGRLSYQELQEHARQGYIGLDLLESRSLSYYYSLSNKTFDYLNVGLPVIQMKFPEYENIHLQYSIGVLINCLNKENLLLAIKSLDQPQIQDECRKQCREAAKRFHWEQETKVMLQIFDDFEQRDHSSSKH